MGKLIGLVLLVVVAVWLLRRALRSGQRDDIERKPPVHIFVMGGGDGQRNAEGRLNHGGRWRSCQLLGRVQVIA